MAQRKIGDRGAGKEDLVERVIREAKAARLDSDTLNMILEEMQGPGAQPDTLSPLQEILMAGAMRDVRDSRPDVDAGVLTGRSKAPSRADQSRSKSSETAKRSVRSSRALSDLDLAPEFSLAAPDALRVAARTSAKTKPSGDVNAADRSQLRASDTNKDFRRLEEAGLSPYGIPQPNISVRDTRDPNRTVGKDSKPVDVPPLRKGEPEKAKDPNAAGLAEKLLPYLGLAGLIGSAIARHNEGPRVPQTFVRDVNGGKIVTTTTGGPRLSEALLAGSQGAFGASQDLTAGRQGKQEEAAAQQQAAFDNEMQIREERQKTAGALLKAGLNEPAIAMMQMDNPELSDIDFSKMTEEKSRSQRLDALIGLMRPTVFSRLEPDVQDTVVRDWWDAHGLTPIGGSHLVAREDPNRVISSQIALKMLSMGIDLPPETLKSLRIPVEQATAFTSAARVAQSKDDQKAEMATVGSLTRMLESLSMAAGGEGETQTEIDGLAAALLPRMSALAKAVGGATPIPTDATILDVTNDPEEPLSVEEAIDLLRDPAIRGRSRASHEQALRTMGVDMSDPRILNELDTLREDQ